MSAHPQNVHTYVCPHTYPYACACTFHCAHRFLLASEFQTPYTLDFGKMTQTNEESKSVRSIRRVADQKMEEVEEVPTAPVSVPSVCLCTSVQYLTCTQCCTQEGDVICRWSQNLLRRVRRRCHLMIPNSQNRRNKRWFPLRTTPNHR